MHAIIYVFLKLVSIASGNVYSFSDYFRALNLVRAGFSGILPPRMSSDLYSRSSVPLGLPLLLKGNEAQSNQKNLLCYPFPDTPKHFTCEKCGRSYASSGNLKRHKKYECGVEPQFSCPICKKKFQHRHSVKIHVFSTHRNEAGESTSDSTQNSTSTLFATPDGVPSVGPSVWHLPPEASTAASQNQEGWLWVNCTTVHDNAGQSKFLIRRSNRSKFYFYCNFISFRLSYL